MTGVRRIAWPAYRAALIGVCVAFTSPVRAGLSEQEIATLAVAVETIIKDQSDELDAVVHVWPYEMAGDHAGVT